MVQLRTGHGACESWPSPGGNYCVDVCECDTGDGGTGWAWRLSEGSGLCQGSQLESSRVSTSSSRHPETKEWPESYKETDRKALRDKHSCPAFVEYKLDSWVGLSFCVGLKQQFCFKFQICTAMFACLKNSTIIQLNWTVTLCLSSVRSWIEERLFSRSINCCVLRIISLLEVNCLQLGGGGGSVSASQNQDWCVSDHPSSGPLVLISLLLGVIGILTKVKLVMDLLTRLYLVSTKMLSFELSD